MSKTTLFDHANRLFIALLAVLCTLPLLLVFMVSITDERSIMTDGYRFIPERFSLAAYRMLFDGDSPLLRSYAISTFVTALGTAVAVLMTAMAGYTLASRHIKYRNALAMFFFVTMVFSAGLVPWYMINTALGLRDTLLALIVPSLLFNPFNLFLVRNYMRGLPESLTEAAKIDGAGDAYIAFRIYIPLSLPVIATIALFYGIAYWNNWSNAILLIDSPSLYPLQYMLFKLQSEISMIQQMQSAIGSVTAANLPNESVKMATAILTIGPIVLFYPLLQRYFVKGLLIGSIKE